MDNRNNYSERLTIKAAFACHFFTMPNGSTVEPPDTSSYCAGRLTAVQVGDSVAEPYNRYNAYGYDSRGNIVAQRQGYHTSFTVDYSISYDYDDDGNLASVLYPNGDMNHSTRKVIFTPQTGDKDRIAGITTTVSGCTVNAATAITYYPVGDIRTMTYGNNLQFANSVDKRYFPKEISSGSVMDLEYTAGPRGNIGGIIDHAHLLRANQSFGYDLKDQLNGSTGEYGHFKWTYDGLGNRVSEVHGNTTTYSYASGTNRLTQTSVQVGTTVNLKAFGYDNVGSMATVKSYVNSVLGDSVTLANNDDSRLVSGTNQSASLGSYVYDHLGQRMMKNTPTMTTLYLYDIFGNLIMEADTQLNPINSYIYLGNHRIAVVGGAYTGSFGCSVSHMKQSAKANWAIIILAPLLVVLGFRYRRNKYVVGMLVIVGSGLIILIMSEEAKSITYNESMYFYHNDHLGTPQVITANNGDVVWDAVYEPFGKINNYAVNTFNNNFRFPGQYEDDGTGMYYNWNRYYIPEIGSYNRFDPLLGVSYYAIYAHLQAFIYSAQNPILNIDILGLQACCTDESIGRLIGQYDKAYADWLLHGGFHVGNCAEAWNWGTHGNNFCGAWADQLAAYLRQQVTDFMGCCKISTGDYPQPSYGGTGAHVAVAVSCQNKDGRWYDPYNWPFNVVAPSLFNNNPLPPFMWITYK